MKPFICDICNEKIKAQDAIIRWHFDKKKKSVSNFQIVHNNGICIVEKKNFFNRNLSLEYVFKNMPEFITYIKRFNFNEKELKEFVHRIEKDRSYIRRFNVNKKEVKRLIILMDGLGE